MRTQSHLLIALALLCAVAAAAQRGDDADRASKNGKAAGTIGGVEVTLEYGRPQVKGRTIWDGLVPYGKVWRTGANEATIISFSNDVLVEGQKLLAGTYSLFTIPTEEEWVIIFNKTANQWGAFSYDAGQDALRVSVKPQSADHEEWMSFSFNDLSSDSATVVLRWEKLAVPFKIQGAQ